MRYHALFKKSVVTLLGLNFPCQVEETPSSFNYTHCIVTGILGTKLAVPIGLSIYPEYASRPVHLQWFMRRRGSFEDGCAVVYVSVANGFRENLAAAAIYRMLTEQAHLLGPQSLNVLRISKEGRGDLVEPTRYLAELQAERFEKTHARRNGYVTRGPNGQVLIQSGSTQFEVSLASFPGSQYLRKIGRLHPGEKVSFRPSSSDSVRVAAEIRFAKILPRPRLRCA